MTQRGNKQKVHCLNCKHLRITWSPSTPYFCRAWSIRSRKYPCEEVFSASGISCQKFDPKTPKTGRTRRSVEQPVKETRHRRRRFVRQA